MRVYDLIWKKREGGELTKEEIRFLITGYVKGEIPDYQMSAWCMAVFFRGMSFDEAAALTLEMANSGETIDLSSVPGIKVDKHSTGGVGDKTSLALLPLVAAGGAPVAKMSGRGLGHTGGTLDKLESIPGFQTTIAKEKFLKQVAEIGLALAGQSGNLVPADKKLYALRDLTATVESIPLIASSIVSKKLASGADAVVLDVKFGDGALMSRYPDALKLAETMVEIGARAGKRFKAVLSDMSQPLGIAIGNSLEVAEAIQTLKGEGPADLTELCLTLSGWMLWLGGKADTPERGRGLAEGTLRSGRALEKLRQLIAAQGGDPAVIEDASILPKAPVILSVPAECEGWVKQISCRELGLIAMRLGAGRTRLQDSIKNEVGLRVFAKVGRFFRAGETMVEIHALTDVEAGEAAKAVRTCFLLSKQFVPEITLIKNII